MFELGRKKESAVPALSGVRCLSIGRMLARTECGLAHAARALTKGQAQDLQMGLNTVRVSIRFVGQAIPAGNGVVRKILSQVETMDRDLRRGKISKSKSGEMFRSLQNMKLDVDRLFAASTQACPGGSGRKR